jgi:hypothetical protein
MIIPGLSLEFLAAKAEDLWVASGVDGKEVFILSDSKCTAF